MDRRVGKGTQPPTDRRDGKGSKSALDRARWQGLAATRRRRPYTFPGSTESDRIRRSFLAMALTHELKQPLNSLCLNVELLSRRLGRTDSCGADFSGPLQALTRVVERMSACMDTFVARAQPDPIPARPRDLRPIMIAAAQRVQAIASQTGVRIDVFPGMDLPSLPAHAHHLGIAFEALLGNAVLASQRGGTVSLSATREGDEVRIAVATTAAGCRRRCFSGLPRLASPPAPARASV
ncbi:MAG: hypothetical protein V2A73_19735 [Pseudomonadota bacterium]